MLGPGAVERDRDLALVLHVELVEAEAVVEREVEAFGRDVADVDVGAQDGAVLKQVRPEQRAVGLAQDQVAVGGRVQAVIERDVGREGRNRVRDVDVIVIDAEVHARDIHVGREHHTDRIGLRDFRGQGRKTAQDNAALIARALRNLVGAAQLRRAAIAVQRCDLGRRDILAGGVLALRQGRGRRTV